MKTFCSIVLESKTQDASYSDNISLNLFVYDTKEVKKETFLLLSVHAF